MASIFLMHAYHDTVHVQLDDRWFHMPPGEPVEFERQFDADKVIEIYGPIYGLIEVPSTKTRTGIHIDVESGEEMAQAELQRRETSLLLEWVRIQQEDRVKNGAPPLPPSGRVKEIIEANHIDVKARFNLNILGFETVLADPEKVKLQQENAELRAKVAQSDSALAAILARLDVIEKGPAAATSGNKPQTTGKSN